VGFYRGMPASDAAVAPDGSLLAVVYDQVVTLWDPLTNTLQAGLTHASLTVPRIIPSSGADGNTADNTQGEQEASVRKVAFAGTDLPYLVSHTAHGLFVWNLLSCSVAWSLGLNVDAMAVDPSGSGRFVVATTLSSDPTTRASALVVFQHDSPLPLQILKVAGQSIVSLSFHPKTEANTPVAELDFIALNSNSKLIRVAREQECAGEQGETVEGVAGVQAAPSRFAAMFGAGTLR
jgi:NET1-associated nuclear protein 1 (U3 small nucleolar RNA-associated protein 17)